LQVEYAYNYTDQMRAYTKHTLKHCPLHNCRVVPAQSYCLFIQVNFSFQQLHPMFKSFISGEKLHYIPDPSKLLQYR